MGELSDRIEQLIAELGFETQKAFCVHYGVGEDAIGRWKKGSGPSSATRSRLAVDRKVTVSQMKAYLDYGEPLPSEEPRDATRGGGASRNENTAG